MKIYRDWIVVWDPTGEREEGSIVSSMDVPMLESKGIALLPINRALIVRAGNGGFAIRKWAKTLPLDFIAPRRFSPMVVWADSSSRVMSWKMLLTPNAHAKSLIDTNYSSRPSGYFQIQKDPMVLSQTSSVSPTTPQVVVESLGSLSSGGTWVVEGDAAIQPQSEGYIPVCFYGTAPGLEVTITAISVA